jgi:hypothetical protein
MFSIPGELKKFNSNEHRLSQLVFLIATDAAFLVAGLVMVYRGYSAK